MRHNVFGKQLSRDTGQRQALLKGLAGALIRSEAIETTEAKAKAAVSLIEKLIAKAKTAKLADVRHIESVIADKMLVQKLVQDIAPRFKDRKGGFLRLVKLGTRSGDNAPMVRMEFTDKATDKPLVAQSEAKVEKAPAKAPSKKAAAPRKAAPKKS
jgi:large subunit ribosomal protein L17